MTDLDTIARRAGAAARTEAAARTRHLSFEPEMTRRPGSRRRVWSLAVALLALTVAVTLMVGEFGGSRGIVIEPVAPGAGQGFVATGSLQMGCAWCPAALLDDGRVLVVGGWDPTGGGRRLPAELYDPTTGTFTATGTPAGDYGQGALVRLTDGRVLVVGRLTPTAELYDPTTGVFAAVPGSMEAVLEALSGPPADELSATPVALADGRVLLIGPSAAAIFDPDTGELGPTAEMDEVRPGGSTATLLDDGRVLVAGGATMAELYDPATGTFTPAGPTQSPRDGHTATRLDDGRVLLAGGTSATAEIFDPATSSFTPTGSMATARFWHTAALLPDGRVLVVGGSSDSGGRTVAATAEIYDPITGQFTPAPAPTGDRRAATAVTLANGDVLVLGNYPGNGGTRPDPDSPTAEIFSLSDVERPSAAARSPWSSPGAPVAVATTSSTRAATTAGASPSRSDGRSRSWTWA